MNDAPRIMPPAALWPLLEAVCEGTLTTEQSRQLEQLVRHDAEARWVYLQYVSVHAVLPRHVGGRAPAAAIGDLLAALPPERPVARPVAPPLGRGARLLAYINQPAVFCLIFATAFVLAGMTLMRIVPMPWKATAAAPPRNPGPLPITPRKVAVVTNVHNCQWGAGPLQPAQGQAVRAGQVLDLQAGLAEITLQNSVRVLLQGPGRWEVSTAQLSRLHYGRLTVRVPDNAAGYTVETPSAIVVDLGTEFGVRVDVDGGSHVDVFQGRVLLKPRTPGEQGLVLDAGHGSQIGPLTHSLTPRPLQTGGYARNFTTRPARFHDTPLPAQKPVVLAHWSFDDLDAVAPNGQSPVRDHSDFGRHAVLEGAPRLVTGAAEYGGGHALHFAAPGDAVVFRSAPPAPDGSHAGRPSLNFEQIDSFTLEAVIRIEPGAHFVGGLIAKDLHSNEPSWWLRVNQGTLEGAVEDFDRDNRLIGLVRGRTDLADGRWHHVALVRDAPLRRLRLYVDHQLDAAADDPTRGSFANTQDLRIGAFNKPERQFFGDIQFARISLGALAPHQFEQPTTKSEPPPERAAQVPPRAD